MKNLLLLFCLSISCSLSFAQDIPEKANTIIITLENTDQAIEKVEKAFKSKGFDVKSKTETTVVSDVKTIKNNSRMMASADINEAEVILTGKIVIVGQGNIPIEYKGKKGTAIMNAWEEMEKVAKAMDGEITYEKR